LEQRRIGEKETGGMGDRETGKMGTSFVKTTDVKKGKAVNNRSISH
jgi:hypothetical protein